MKKQCQGKVLSSQKQCKNNAVDDTDYCYRHGTQPGSTISTSKTRTSQSIFSKTLKAMEERMSLSPPIKNVSPPLKCNVIPPSSTKNVPKKTVRFEDSKQQSQGKISFSSQPPKDQTSLAQTPLEKNPIISSSPDISDIVNMLEKQKEQPQLNNEINRQVAKLIEISKSMPEQKTLPWLAMRYNMLTASDIAACLVVTDYELNLHDEQTLFLPKANYKLGKGCYPYKNIKMFLREKCEPEKRFMGNRSTFHGTKYEHVATQTYSFKNGETVHEFGLMPHQVHSFLGASPDGITSTGRMLEIKVPLSRELNGIPPIQYWVQMQLQMECCDLDVCDFVECKISEYNSEHDYLEDTFVDESGNEIYGLTKNGMHKGCVLEIKYVDGDNSKSVYKYAPVSVTMKNHDEMVKWTIDELSKLANENDRQNFIEIMLQEGCMSIERSWWKIDQYSQVEVKRDPVWFSKRFYDFEEFWSNVVKYRAEGIPECCKAKSKKGKNGEEIECDDEEEVQSKLKQEPKFSAKSKSNKALKTLSHYDKPDDIDININSNTQQKLQPSITTKFAPKKLPVKIPLKKGEMGFCIVNDDEDY